MWVVKADFGTTAARDKSCWLVQWVSLPTLGQNRRRRVTVGYVGLGGRSATCPGPRIARSSQRPCRRPGRPCPRSRHPSSRRPRPAADSGSGQRLGPLSGVVTSHVYRDPATLATEARRKRRAAPSLRGPRATCRSWPAATTMRYDGGRARHHTAPRTDASLDHLSLRLRSRSERNNLVAPRPATARPRHVPRGCSRTRLSIALGPCPQVGQCVPDDLRSWVDSDLVGLADRCTVISIHAGLLTRNARCFPARGQARARRLPA